MVTNEQDRQRLQEQCRYFGLQFDLIEHHLYDSSFDDMGGESWCEIELGAPGDLKKTPCVVHCFNSNQSGSATKRNYSYI